MKNKLNAYDSNWQSLKIKTIVTPEILELMMQSYDHFLMNNELQKVLVSYSDGRRVILSDRNAKPEDAVISIKIDHDKFKFMERQQCLYQKAHSYDRNYDEYTRTFELAEECGTASCKSTLHAMLYVFERDLVRATLSMGGRTPEAAECEQAAAEVFGHTGDVAGKLGHRVPSTIFKTGRGPRHAYATLTGWF